MRIFKKTAFKKTIFFVAADCVSISFSIWASFLIRFDGIIPQSYFFSISRITVLAIILIIPIFYFLKLYSFSWSYFSTNEIISLFLGAAIAFSLLGIAVYFSNIFPYFYNFPRSTLFISYFLTLILCGGIRLSKKISFYFLPMARLVAKERTLIVGAGDAGEQILRGIISSKNSSYLPVGFVDDNPIKQGIEIHGVKVLGKIPDIEKISANYNIKQLIIALPTAGSRTIKNAVELGRKAGLKKIKIAPSITDIINGQISLHSLKDVGAEDLLGRERVLIETGQIENFIKNKVILVTGAAGSIGSELSRQAAKFGPRELLLLDQDETGIFNISEELKNKFYNLEIKSLVADILDRKKLEQVFTDFQPEIIFHAAAYKHVPLMEEQPDQAVKNNIFGTQTLAEISLSNHAEKFIFISTDKAVNPSSVMGSTKRVGEMICQAYNQKNHTKFISVRFGNVLDSRGSVIPTFREQIRKGGSVEVTHPDMKRYFMLISEACLLVMQAGAMGRGGEVFVLDMGQPIKILDLAKEMIKLSGLQLDKDIAIVFTSPRPGEKLFEEILTAEEGTTATANQKIFMAKLSGINPSDLEKKLDELKSSAYGTDAGRIKELLSAMVLWRKT